MRADKFARIVLSSCFTSVGDINDSDFGLLKALCFYQNRCTSFCYEKLSKKVFVMGNPYGFHQFSSFFAKLGIDIEKVDVGSALYKDVRITKNSRLRIKPFIDKIRLYFECVYGFRVDFDKFGDIYSMTGDSSVVNRKNIFSCLERMKDKDNDFS